MNVLLVNLLFFYKYFFQTNVCPCKKYPNYMIFEIVFDATLTFKLDINTFL